VAECGNRLGPPGVRCRKPGPCRSRTGTGASVNRGETATGFHVPGSLCDARVRCILAGDCFREPAAPRAAGARRTRFGSDRRSTGWGCSARCGRGSASNSNRRSPSQLGARHRLQR
jgi:hypothetical protein